MSSRLPKHLHDALVAARLAVRFVGAADDATYLADVMLRSAVERQLEILGEACKRILDEDPGLRERLPEAPLALALRNRIIHGYDRVEHAVVLDTVRSDLPGLIEKLEAELRRYPLA
jgi:uncharacterized protein with HEPN domain